MTSVNDTRKHVIGSQSAVAKISNALFELDFDEGKNEVDSWVLEAWGEDQPVVRLPLPIRCPPDLASA